MHSFIVLDRLIIKQTTKNFAFYIIVRGRQSDIYKHWQEIVDLSINYSYP